MEELVTAVINDTESKTPFLQPILELFTDVKVKSQNALTGIKFSKSVNSESVEFTAEKDITLRVKSVHPAIIQVQITKPEESNYKSWR
jgi:hypothetical protein